jgi:hypothetical protein
MSRESWLGGIPTEPLRRQRFSVIGKRLALLFHLSKTKKSYSSRSADSSKLKVISVGLPGCRSGWFV